MSVPATTNEVVESLEEYPDVISWINDTLSPESVPSLTELDQRITQLVGTLDIACEDTSTDLERVIDDVSRGVPRLTYDLHFMKDSALSLQSAVVKVHQQAKNAVPETTGAALERLRTLDTMKRNMEAARDVLKEAESWSTLEMEVTSLLAEGSYGKAAERLSEANKSMSVFHNTPEYDPRRTLMVNLQNQLEASLSTALVSAINGQDMAACRNYYGIFSQIQREPEFRNYYNGSRRAHLVTMWQEASLSDCDETPAGSSHFSTFLPTFFSYFLTLLNQERLHIPSIFPDPPQSLSNLIVSVFTSLRPTFSQRLSGLVSHYGAAALPQLIMIFKSTEDFAHSVDKIVEKIRYSSIMSPTPITEEHPPTISDGSTPKGHRRRSSRMSISWRQGRSNSSGINLPKIVPDELDWDQEVFQPFVQFQVDYGTLERKLLEATLQEIVTSDQQEKVLGSDQARLMRERAVDILGVAEDSLSRCTSLTYGFASVGLVQALDGLFQSFIDMWTADVSVYSTQQSSVAGTAASGEDLSDLDYTPKDWSDFQLSLHLLSSAHVVYERMTSFEIKLKSHLVQVSQKFRMARNDPENFPIAASKGEWQILEQSTLNSAELHSLLGRVEPDPAQIKEAFISASSTAGLRHSVSLPAPGVAPTVALLMEARGAIFNFAKTCQVSLQNTILSPLRKHLRSYASLPVWSSSSDPNSRHTTTSTELHVPTFSLSPTDTVQRVAEGLLNLPRLFETYADDDALSFSLHTLPHINDETLKALAENSSQPEAAPTSSSGGPSHHRRTSITAPPKAEAVMDPEAISSAWLASLAQTLLVHLTSSILPQIASLSPAGAKQLASDLGYLSNIVRALNVEFEELEKWKEYVEMSDDAGKIKEREGGEGDLVWGMVARMRGWGR